MTLTDACRAASPNLYGLVPRRGTLTHHLQITRLLSFVPVRLGERGSRRRGQAWVSYADRPSDRRC